MNKKYPCKNCILQATCNQKGCCLLITLTSSLYNSVMINNQCPDCNYTFKNDDVKNSIHCSYNIIHPNMIITKFIFVCDHCNSKFRTYMDSKTTYRDNKFDWVV